jgi:hypothetical protein
MLLLRAGQRLQSRGRISAVLIPSRA